MAATAQTKASSPATVSSISSFDTRTAVHELPPTKCSVVPSRAPGRCRYCWLPNPRISAVSSGDSWRGTA